MGNTTIFFRVKYDNGEEKIKTEEKEELYNNLTGPYDAQAVVRESRHFIAYNVLF